MKTIVLASQKGGAGKTTICGQLSTEAAADGYRVVLIDTDPQGGLAEWWNVRQADSPEFSKPTRSGLAASIKTLAQDGVDLCLIDTPPAITDSVLVTFAVADLVVVPVSPSPHDLRAVGATVSLVERAKKPLVFVINRATQRARITADTAIALSQHGTVAPVTLHHRTDFATSMIDGRTVGELDPASKSAREMAALWTYVKSRLKKGEPE